MSTNGLATAADLNLALQAGIQADLLRVLDRTARVSADHAAYNARARDALAALACGIPPGAAPMVEDEEMRINVNSPTTINYPAAATTASNMNDENMPVKTAATTGMGWLAKSAIVAGLLGGGGGLGAGALALYQTATAKPAVQAAAPAVENAAGYILGIKEHVEP